MRARCRPAPRTPSPSRSRHACTAHRFLALPERIPGYTPDPDRTCRKADREAGSARDRDERGAHTLRSLPCASARHHRRRRAPPSSGKPSRFDILDWSSNPAVSRHRSRHADTTRHPRRSARSVGAIASPPSRSGPRTIHRHANEPLWRTLRGRGKGRKRARRSRPCHACRRDSFRRSSRRIRSTAIRASRI